MSKCPNPICYNYDEANELFCEKCLAEAVSHMNEEELYDIFIEGEQKIKEAIRDGEAHGILTAQEKRIYHKYKHRWFRTINEFMLKQFNKK